MVRQADSEPDGHRRLSFEAEMPSSWFESQLLRVPMWGPLLVPVYRHLAQHAPATRIAPVPGDVLFLEIAIADTCRFFAGLNGADSYSGIVETAPFFDSLQELLPQLGDRDPVATLKPYRDLGRAG